MINLKYRKQVNLLLEVVGPILNDDRLALKGGTAINMFAMNMPRLSVDLDLVYLPITERKYFLAEIQDVYRRMQERLALYATKILNTRDGIPRQMYISDGNSEVKAEVNLILRGVVFPPQTRRLCKKAQELFEKDVRVRCTSLEDQYAGKFCAALDRQHPRDLFDVKLLAKSSKRLFLFISSAGTDPSMRC